jgi:hypothetical protein
MEITSKFFRTNRIGAWVLEALLLVTFSSWLWALHHVGRLTTGDILDWGGWWLGIVLFVEVVLWLDKRSWMRKHSKQSAAQCNGSSL